MRNKRKNKVSTTIVMAVCIVLISCRGNNSTNESKKQDIHDFIDMSDRKVEIPITINKIVSNGPSGTIILYSLAEELLVARNFKSSDGEKRYCTSRYCRLPEIGRWFLTSGSRNTEVILKLNPDVIISCGNVDQAAVARAEQDQNYLGIPVLQFSTGFTELIHTYQQLGKLLGKEEKAKELISFIEKYVFPLMEHARSLPETDKPSVYLAIGDNGLTTSPRGSIHAQFIEFAGAVNVADNEKVSGHSEINMEQVISWDPDIILACEKGSLSSDSLKNTIENKGEWKNIKAVKFEQVYAVPMKPYCWVDLPPSINQIPGVIWLSKILFPDWFPFDIEKVVQEFYTSFYHCQLTKEEIKLLLNANIRLN
jgi:iron complex transport system substrate-binding protein